MRDEPRGRFVVRQTGKPLTAKKFHYYRDCGLIRDSKPPDWETIDLGLDETDETARTIDLLGLTACTSCQTRADEVSAFDVITDAIVERQHNADPATTLAQVITERLEQYGYEIKRVRKGGMKYRDPNALGNA